MPRGILSCVLFFLDLIATTAGTTPPTGVESPTKTCSTSSCPRDGRSLLQHITEAATVELGQRTEPTDRPAMSLAEAEAISRNMDDAFTNAESLDEKMDEFQRPVTTLAEAESISRNIDDAFTKAEALDTVLAGTEKVDELEGKSAKEEVNSEKAHSKSIKTGTHSQKKKKRSRKAKQSMSLHESHATKIAEKNKGVKHSMSKKSTSHQTSSKRGLRESGAVTRDGDSIFAIAEAVDHAVAKSNMNFKIKSLVEASKISRNMDDAFAKAEAMDQLLSPSEEVDEDKNVSRNMDDAFAKAEAMDKLFRPSKEVAKALGLPKNLLLVQIEDVARSFAAKSQGKAEPLGIAKWIKDQMIPHVELTKREMAKEVARAAEAVGACEAILQATDKDAHKREVVVRTSEARYAECNVSAAQLSSDQQEACDDLKEYSDSLDIPTCLDRIYRHSIDLMEDTLQKNWEFFNSAYPKFMEKKKMCEDMKIKKEMKSTQCAREKEGLEGSLCALRSARKFACSEYSACRDTMVDRFKKAKADIKILEEKTKEEYKALHRIECFIGILVEGEQTEAQDSASQRCNPDSVDVTHLDIEYPLPGDANSCETIIATTEDYSSLECPAELDESSDDSGAEESEQIAEAGDGEVESLEDNQTEVTEGAEAALSQIEPPGSEAWQPDYGAPVKDVQRQAAARRLPMSQRRPRSRRQRQPYAYARGDKRVHR